MDKEKKAGVQQCLKCGKKLVGRLDKKFCDAYCRNSFNNQNKTYSELEIQHIQRVLRHNRKILKTLCPQGKATVRKSVLDQMGYDFRYFSSIYKSPTNLYYLNYDFGFSPITQKGVRKALIIQKQEYMDKLGFGVWQS